VDAFETTNSLSIHSGAYKVEGLYNVHAGSKLALQSKLSSIFLVALWHSRHVKAYGYDVLLQPVVRSLMQLESDAGAVVNTRGQTRTVRAALVMISADNLGFNSLFGFSESFTATRYC
jgi:hypothetical protein